MSQNISILPLFMKYSFIKLWILFFLVQCIKDIDALFSHLALCLMWPLQSSLCLFYIKWLFLRFFFSGLIYLIILYKMMKEVNKNLKNWEALICSQVRQKSWTTWGPTHVWLASDVGTVLWDWAFNLWSLMVSGRLHQSLTKW